ncbi:rpsU-divergently transcribed protein [Ruegeria denitrificans]|uniref:RpsU-divergently transcribed protein n=1 Tax=Ruegeria denitrificans TaxID=1715692 RepID=A0A0P1I9P5_9RHOB|nr:COQ9 family protein [Ruegeria denitrificans]CUK00252.1 rpsU-divergently transcribed protein [Ruegeria denitrificans]
MTVTYEDAKQQLLDAMLTHVPFDGWSETSFRAAIIDCDLDDGLARAICPRGAVDLALAFHARGDAAMVERLKSTDLSELKFRERVAAAVRFRLEAVPDKELVRRGMTLFSLPTHAADGAKALWQTCDLIWDTLGDTSDDVNWYTKRATLSGVYSSTLLFWLGDDSPDHQKTWEFLDRRIDNVMQFEKLKAQVNGNPLFKPFLAVPNWFASHVKPPVKMRVDLPGMLNPRK